MLGWGQTAPGEKGQGGSDVLQEVEVAVLKDDVRSCNPSQLCVDGTKGNCYVSY